MIGANQSRSASVAVCMLLLGAACASGESDPTEVGESGPVVPVGIVDASVLQRDAGRPTGDAASDQGSDARSPSRGTVEAIHVQDSFSCAIRVGGALACWGLTPQDLTYRDTPLITVAAATSWPPGAVIGALSAVSIGGTSTCAIRRSTDGAGGAVTCWGKNADGSLGNGHLAGGRVPSSVLGLQDVTQISHQGNLVAAVRANGEVVRWGGEAQRYGELSIEPTVFENTGTPTPVSGMPLARKVAAGQWHICALTRDGEVYCAGHSTFVGVGATIAVQTPMKVELPPVVDLAANVTQTCAVTSGGDVYCWGSGSAKPEPDLTPQIVAGVSKAASIAVGASHKCAAHTDGSVSCWGWNSNGQLGRPPSPGGDPEPVPGLTDAVVQVAAGSTHSCARTATGVVFCWGGSAKLGNLTATAPAGTPVLVDAL